jgi:hypothetical protein
MFTKAWKNEHKLLDMVQIGTLDALPKAWNALQEAARSTSAHLHVSLDDVKWPVRYTKVTKDSIQAAYKWLVDNILEISSDEEERVKMVFL